MNEQLTDVTFLVDRSGSMASKKTQVEEALAEIINSQKNGVGKVNLTVTEFDSDYRELSLHTSVSCVPIENVERVTLDPRGGTPLYDALCTVVDDTGKRLASLPESQRPAKVVFVIVTDGGENASIRFKAEEVAARIKHQEQNYNWMFMYVGCDQNAVKEAGSFGLSAGKSMTFVNNPRGYKGLTDSVGEKLRNVRSMNAVEYASYNSGEVFNANDRAIQEASK